MEKKDRRTTLLELVRAVQDTCRSDAEVIAVITHMVNTGRVVLRGNFARQQIDAASSMAAPLG